MISLVLLELLSVIALIFSVLLIFVEAAAWPVVAQLFAWSLGVSLFNYYARSWGKVFRLSGILLLLPLFFLTDMEARIFIIIAALSLILYLERSLHRGSHDDYVDNFRRMTIIVYPIAFFIRFAGGEMGRAVNRATPFIFLYFLAAILLIRLVRHVEAGMQARRLRSTNLGYLLFVALFLSFASVPQVRQMFGSLALQSLALLLLPVRLVLWLLGWVLAMFSGWILKRPIAELEIPQMPDFGLEDEFTLPQVGEQPVIVAVVLAVLKVVVGLLLIAAAVFIIYRLLVRVGQKGYQGLDYIEEREYLGIAGQKRRRRFLRRERLPEQPAEQVRYYYRRFLQLLVTRNVDLANSDTSWEIQKKAEPLFPEGPQQMRQIYVASRYGEKEVSSATAQAMEQLYKEL